MKPVLISKLAQSEIREAAFFYENRKQGLGEQFKERVAEAIGIIEQNPESFRMIYKDLRRVQLKQFEDYALWYRIRPDNSLVVACLSGRRHPIVVKERAAGIIPFPKPPEPS